MITSFLYRLFCSDRKLEQKTSASIEVLAGDETKEEPTASLNPKYDDPEIAIIDKYYGPLVNGLVIEAALSDMLKILPRQRRKSDSYKGLAARLRVFGVTLRVSSQYAPQNYEAEGEKCEEE